MTNFQGIVRCKCPKCKTGKIFEDNGNVFVLRAPRMHAVCSSCGYKFEKEPGYFIGSLYVSYALAVAEMLFLFCICFPFLSFEMLFLVLILGLLLLSFFNFRYARTIWIYLFQL
ncbi:MAG: DUF983 domain-containing protein [Crocinitomicaceae bacterium]|nr:MAG: DUF983 domain-containing protein [Crocinitomicaceae bacterium]